MTEPLYNLELLKKTSDDEAFLNEIIHLFEVQTIENLHALRHYCDEADWDAVYFAAHKLKSSVVLFQIIPAIASVKAIEKAAKNRQKTESIDKLIKQLAYDLEAVLREMKRDFPR